MRPNLWLAGMQASFLYDFAISYAGPDQVIVEEAVRALQSRGFSVYFSPKNQGEMIAETLKEKLTRVYLHEARFCLLFGSEHYLKSRWTMDVELPAATLRQTTQQQRYLIPVRLTKAEIPGVIDTSVEQMRVDIRSTDPRRIADLCVSIALRDDGLVVASSGDAAHDKLLLRVTELTSMDKELLRSSFAHFTDWLPRNAHMIPVEIRLPRFLVETLQFNDEIIKSAGFRDYSESLQSQFTQLMSEVRKELDELLLMPYHVLIASQPSGRFTLTDPAIELIERFLLSKVIAIARCLATWQLKGQATLPWASRFGACEAVWSPCSIMPGLAWLCRSDESERYFWFDADIHSWSGGHFAPVRFRQPSRLSFRQSDQQISGDDVLRFIAPQLLERELKGLEPSLLADAFRHPTEIRITDRDENVIECQHLSDSTISNQSDSLAPSIEAFREAIVEQHRAGRLGQLDAIHQLHCALSVFTGFEELLWPAIRQLHTEPR